MDSRNRPRRLRNMLATSAWVMVPLLIITFVLMVSTRSSPPVAEAHGLLDQSQVDTGGNTGSCFAVSGCGQTFTPAANNIVAFDLNVFPQSALPPNGTFVLRQ